jgi:predicted 2-oxoglutarate/Fe(II)-dependent dioxygenase YbiX
MKIPSLLDYVQFLPKEIPADFCDEILRNVEERNKWLEATIMSGEVYKEIRDVNLVGLREWPELDQQMYEILNGLLINYAEIHPDIVVSKDEGYTILRYSPGQYYRKHTDHGTTIPRALSCVIGLTDKGDYKGGKFSMWDGAMEYKLGKGDVLLFPANYLYPHEVTKIKWGTRYTIVTWFN